MSFVHKLLGDDHTIEVVGESHYKKTLNTIVEDSIVEPDDKGYYEVPITAHLIHEPNNPYDKNAVMVQIDGSQVGYLGREDAADFMKVVRKHKAVSLDDVFEAPAFIRGREGIYGVFIDVNMPPEIEVGAQEYTRPQPPAETVGSMVRSFVPMFVVLGVVMLAIYFCSSSLR